MFLISIRRTGVIRDRNWVAIGGLTYPLYLIHANIGFMVFNLAYPAVNQHILLLGTIFMMIVFAYLVNRKVERRYSKSLQIILERAFTSIAMCLTGRRKSRHPYNREIGKVQEGSYESRGAL
jgi:peptidoglycan/LPS O-acetylase OafA/YrhL